MIYVFENSRSIVCVEGDMKIGPPDLAEAICYRTLDRKIEREKKGPSCITPRN